MAISVSTTLGIDDIGLASGRTYRVGDNGVVISGNRIASFDDDGLVFAALEYVPSPGGWGEVDPYFVHDNSNGTFNVYFRLTGPDLPLTHRDVYVTLDAETGATIGTTQDLPYSQFGDLGAMGHTDTAGHADGQMLQQAISLSDGTIAIVDATIALNQAVFKIVNADGTSVSLSAAFARSITSHDSQLLFDLTEVGDQIAVVWASDSGAPARLQMFNRDGSTFGAEIALGNTSSSQFGNTPAAQAETLSDGRILVVWVESGTTSGPDQDQTSTWFSVLNADGSEAIAATLVNTEVIAAREDTPLVIVTESGFVIGYSVLDFAGIQEGRVKEYDNMGNLVDTQTGAYTWGTDDIVRTDNNSAFIVGGNIYEIALPGADTPLSTVVEGDRVLEGTNDDEALNGGSGNDLLVGLGGNDTLRGGDGNDTLNGGDGDDFIFGGETDADLRDVVYGGAGNDNIDGGYGNDELRGDAGNDSIAGGFGADTVIGGAGNDTLTGSSYGDEIFGGDGLDFINGGFGHDRVNGGEGADQFYHIGIFDHGSDWIQDYNAADGDVLRWGGAAATVDNFQINTADTANAGVDGVSESFVIYRPTGQIMWALVDGDEQSSINIQIGGETFDLLL
jgi:Ca2+-binding RTX toxin-like protein